jgi:hypothetical protein
MQSSTSPLLISGRTQLFARLTDTLRWQEVSGTEKVPIENFIKGDSVPKELKVPRLESFLGKTIGGRDVPDRFHRSSFGRAFEENKPGSRVFTINDLRNPSVDIHDWRQLGDDFIEVRDHIIERLLEVLNTTDEKVSLEDADDLLQCNVNLYAPNAELALHRDDGSRKDRHGNYKATMDTFYPAAATVVLTPNGSDSRSFELWRCTECFKQDNAMFLDENRSDSCVERHKDCVDSEVLPVEGDKSGIIVLRDDYYRNGVHGLRSLSDEPIDPNSGTVRISLNFRIVRRDAWDMLKAQSE